MMNLYKARELMVGTKPDNLEKQVLKNSCESQVLVREGGRKGEGGELFKC